MSNIGCDSMKILVSLLTFLDSDMTTPVMFGWFHILSLVLTILVTVLLCRVFSSAEEKTVRRIVLYTSVISIVLEVYKQINYTFIVTDGVIVTDYQWYAFPFQFCSTPMYVGLLAGLLRPCKVRDALYSYLATYGLFAGLCVMLYPAQVFISTIGINIQTMICHGLMIVVGIYMMFSEAVKLDHKTILRALPVFVVNVIIAIILNELAYFTGFVGDETFNMFFFSPHYAPSLPVYSIVQQYVSYPWSLFIYIAGFTAAGYIITAIAMLIRRVFSHREK